MDEAHVRVELQIWREEDASGAWRCRVVGPGLLQSVRLADHVALNAYIAGQIDTLVACYPLGRVFAAGGPEGC